MFLPLTDLVRIGDSEELGCNVDEPFRFDGSDVVAIFPRGQDQFVIDNPLRIAVEQRRRRVDIDRSSLDECLVSLLRVLFRSMSEEPRGYCSTDAVEVLARRQYIMFVPAQ